MKLKFGRYSLVAALMLAGCATAENGGTGMTMRRGLLTAGGAGVGWFACKARGGTDAECLAYAAAGALAGYGIGRYLDERDRATYEAAVERAMAQSVDDTTPVTATNAATGNSFEISPISGRGFTNPQGQDCRVYTVDYEREGQTYQEEEQRCYNGTRWVPYTADA